MICLILKLCSFVWKYVVSIWNYMVLFGNYIVFFGNDMFLFGNISSTPYYVLCRNYMFLFGNDIVLFWHDMFLFGNDMFLFENVTLHWEITCSCLEMMYPEFQTRFFGIYFGYNSWTLSIPGVAWHNPMASRPVYVRFFFFSNT